MKFAYLVGDLNDESKEEFVGEFDPEMDWEDFKVQWWKEVGDEWYASSGRVDLDSECGYAYQQDVGEELMAYLPDGYEILDLEREFDWEV